MKAQITYINSAKPEGTSQTLIDGIEKLRVDSAATIGIKDGKQVLVVPHNNIIVAVKLVD